MSPVSRTRRPPLKCAEICTQSRFCILRHASISGGAAPSFCDGHHASPVATLYTRRSSYPPSHRSGSSSACCSGNSALAHAAPPQLRVYVRIRCPRGHLFNHVPRKPPKIISWEMAALNRRPLRTSLFVDFKLGLLRGRESGVGYLTKQPTATV